MVLQKEFFKKVGFEKNQQTTKNQYVTSTKLLCAGPYNDYNKGKYQQLLPVAVWVVVPAGVPRLNPTVG